MKRIFSLLCLSIFLLSAKYGYGKRIFICDDYDKSPLVAASVINNAGELICLSDGQGYINISDKTPLPFIISYQGYGKRSINTLSDTIALTSSIVSLPELVVDRDKTGVRLICLAEETNTNIAGDDTIIIKAKYIVDFVLPFKDKPKGFKQQTRARIINERVEAFRRSKSGMTKIDASEVFYLPMITLVELNTGDIKIPQSISDNPFSNAEVKIRGELVKLRRRNDMLTYSVDALENKKDHKISPGFAKFLGFTMDITRMEYTESFAYHKEEVDMAFDFLGISFGFGGVLKGKMYKKFLDIKEDMQLQANIEIKPIDYQMLNNEESKQIHKNPGSYAFPKQLYSISRK